MVEGTVEKQLPPPQLSPWQPGESGNPAGRPKSSLTTLLKNTSPEDNAEIAKIIIAMAKKGDIQHIREYLDRTEGKVADKHLNINVVTTPEGIQQAQARLLDAQSETAKLLEEYKDDTD